MEIDELLLAGISDQVKPPSVEFCHLYEMPPPVVKPVAERVKFTAAQALDGPEATPALGVPEQELKRVICILGRFVLVLVKEALVQTPLASARYHRAVFAMVVFV